MIDTIVLILHENMYRITAPDKFVPSARWAAAQNSHRTFGLQSKQNPTTKELLQGIYKPRLTLSYRINAQDRREILLKVELSLPKLFFGNNFAELQYKDFAPLTKKLVEVLQQMGVITTADMLARAPISAVHYSKNIPLTDGSTPYHYINKIKEANIKLSLDINKTDYRNDGHAYKWHCNSYEIAFYDKIKDLEQAKRSSKRALEKDSALQLNLFDTLRERKKLEILRMEVRLNKRQKIKQLFNALGIKSDLSFKSIFKPAISRKILLHYIDELDSKRSPLLDYKPVNDKALLVALIINNPDLSPNKILQLYGLKRVLETIDMRELRVMFSKCNQRSWYRLMTDTSKIKLPATHNPFAIIREHVLRFKALRLAKDPLNHG